MPIRRSEPALRFRFGLLSGESARLEIGDRVIEMETQLIVNLTLRVGTLLVVRVAAETCHEDAFDAARLPPSSAFDSAAAVRRQARVC